MRGKGGLPRFGFAGEGVVPCCWLPEGKWGCCDEVVPPEVAAVELEEDGVGFLWQRKKEEEKKSANIGRRCWFFADFGPEFLPLQIIKSDFIYRKWKRAIVSTLWKNYSP
jgi:hypothetical protein